MTRPTTAEKALRFRALHEAATPFVIPNPWDAGSARLLAARGFQALATTSFGSALASGVWDGALSRDEVIASARSVVDACDLPVSADLEAGFGETPEAIAETFRLAGEAGLVGGSIEDYTGDPSRPFYQIAEAVDRLTAAVEAARALPFPFTLTARAENHFRGSADLNDTIRRLQAYEAAGADVLFAPGLPTLDAVRAVCSSVSKPVNFLAGLPGAGFSMEELAAAGVKRISMGGALYKAALQGLVSAVDEIQQNGTFGFTKTLPGGPEMKRWFGMG
ncbi:MAG: isocitrate lyase/phosphoenolpyruvate mutase family protein [Luteolibacter sp.]|uniref:isocitrate lyase/PEP mutase family protein n=1 Tax=Luteolibacter sp. TaxID=1962973 RepID=UPI003263CFEF